MVLQSPASAEAFAERIYQGRATHQLVPGTIIHSLRPVAFRFRFLPPVGEGFGVLGSVASMPRAGNAYGDVLLC